jgi:hypothetical protein
MPRRGTAILLGLAIGAMAWLTAVAARAEGAPRELNIQVRLALAGYELSRLDSIFVFCQVAATPPGPNGFGTPLGSGRGRFFDGTPGERPQDGITMRIGLESHVSAWGGPEPSISSARYFHCHLTYHCLGTGQSPRPLESGDPLLADPATACLGYDAKRSQLSVSGAIPDGWD